MAKKRSRRSGFNMSAAVRELLAENSNLTGKEVRAELKKRYPGKRINPKSCDVAFSNARKRLGISKGRKKSVHKRKPMAGRLASATALNMKSLQAARKYVAEVGDVDAAVQAVRQLKSLQID